MGHLNFSPDSNLIELDVALFGATSSKFRIVNMVLDTGASQTCVSPDAISGLGYDLSTARDGHPAITASGTVLPKLITLSRISAMGEIVEEIDISVMQDFPDELSEMDIHGLLGLNFFRHFDVSICFSSGFIDIRRI